MIEKNCHKDSKRQEKIAKSIQNDKRKNLEAKSYQKLV